MLKSITHKCTEPERERERGGRKCENELKCAYYAHTRHIAFSELVFVTLWISICFRIGFNVKRNTFRLSMSSSMVRMFLLLLCCMLLLLFDVFDDDVGDDNAHWC